ncbi:MAG: DUF115 domain-containing protein [Chlamydiia bacterium]|nr:DUF115 domain-containing protein [Chlamydiia bacterium]
MQQDFLATLEKNHPLIAFEYALSEKKEEKSFPLPLPSEKAVAAYTAEMGGEKWQEEIIQWLEQDPKRILFFLPRFIQAVKLVSVKLLDMSQFIIAKNVDPCVWEHLFQPWECLGAFDRKGEIEKALLQGELTVSHYRDFGKTFLNNCIKNSSLSSKNGRALKGKFEGVPAVICGAGPSLETHFARLKDLKDSALIFGGGSAIMPLAKHKIPLHFIASIDPASPPFRFQEETYSDVPLLFQRQVDPTFLSKHQGPKLCCGKSGSFALEEFLFKDEVFDTGWTVGTFMAAVAIHFGCDPIYFVGMDLAVSSEKRYASGVEGEDGRCDVLEGVNKRGEKVFTRPDFLAAKEWLEVLARNHPEKTWVNLSEGLCIEGIPFGEDIPNERKGDLFAKVKTEVEKLTVAAYSDKKQELEKSIQKTARAIHGALVALAENRSPLLFEVELEEELFYTKHLAPLWEVWKHLLQKREIVSQMEDSEREKKIQQLLFFQEVIGEFT